MLSLLVISHQLLALCMAVCGMPINDVSPQLSAARGNQTTLRSQIAPGLTLSANYRGTLDIVWSCVLTLTACIYTALHLNIPSHFWRKVKWAATALVAPELVLYSALQQFIEARNLVKQLNEQRFRDKSRQQEQNISGTSESTKPFDLRYGFYVIMGGFTVDVEELHNKLSRVTLTPRGVIALAERGRFLDISPETVSDKSKANIITKALICAQVLWMVVQCIARKVVGYPLTLLEIHTMVHVVCALALYVLWWKKPLDINEPTIFYPSDDAEYLEFIALMLISSTNPSITGIRHPGLWNKKAEVNELTIHENPIIEPGAEGAIGSGTESGTNEVPRLSLRDDRGKPPPSAKDIRRWELAYQGMSKDRSMQEDSTAPDLLQTPDPFSDTLTLRSRTIDEYSVISFLDILFDIHSSFESDQRTLLALALLPVAYGGIHLAAWGFEFPSPAESLLWKIGCLIIMCVFFIAFAVINTYLFILKLYLSSLLYKLLEAALGCFFAIGTFLYAAARIFIVVESFLSLRHVPIGVYAAVPWVQNIPHI